MTSWAPPSVLKRNKKIHRKAFPSDQSCIISRGYILQTTFVNAPLTWKQAPGEDRKIPRAKRGKWRETEEIGQRETIWARRGFGFASRLRSGSRDPAGRLMWNVKRLPRIRKIKPLEQWQSSLHKTGKGGGRVRGISRRNEKWGSFSFFRCLPPDHFPIYACYLARQFRR